MVRQLGTQQNIEQNMYVQGAAFLCDRFLCFFYKVVKI